MTCSKQKLNDALRTWNWLNLQLLGAAGGMWACPFAIPNAMLLAEYPQNEINPIHMKVAMGLSVVAVINASVCHFYAPQSPIQGKVLSYSKKTNRFVLEVLGAPGAVWACCFAIPNACLQRGGYHWYLALTFLQWHTWVSVGLSMLSLTNAIACYFPQSLEHGVGQKGSSCLQKINRVILDVLGAPGAVWACFYAIINTFLQRLGYDWYATGDYDEDHLWAGVVLCSIVHANAIYCFNLPENVQFAPLGRVPDEGEGDVTEYMERGSLSPVSLPPGRSSRSSDDVLYDGDESEQRWGSLSQFSSQSDSSFWRSSQCDDAKSESSSIVIGPFSSKRSGPLVPEPLLTGSQSTDFSLVKADDRERSDSDESRTSLGAVSSDGEGSVSNSASSERSAGSGSDHSTSLDANDQFALLSAPLLSRDYDGEKSPSI